MNEAKTIVKYSRLYTISDFINRSAGIILIPFYTHVLSLSDYGIYALIFSVTDVLSIIVGVGLSRAMVRFYFDYSENAEMRNKVVSTTLLGFLGLGILLIIFSYPLSLLVVKLLFSSTEHATLFAIAICSVMFIVFMEIEIRYFLVLKQARLYLALSAGKALLLLSTNVLFVYYLDMGVLGIVISSITSFAILSMTIGIYILRKVGFGFSFDIFKQLLAFGYPLIPSAIAGTGTLLIQRYYLNILAGPVAVGIIALATRLSSFLQMFVAAPFYKIFFIRRFETLAEDKSQSDLNQVMLIFTAVVSTGGLFLGLFGNEIIYIIAPEEYRSAALYIPLLCLSVIITAIDRNFEIGIIYQKKTKVILLLSIIALVISFPINYFLITFYGPMGAVLAHLLVNIARLAMKVKANSMIGMPQIQLNWIRTILLLSLVSAISTFGYQYWADSITTPLILLKMGLFGFFIISLIISPLLDEKSRKTIISILRKKTDENLA